MLPDTVTREMRRFLSVPTLAVDVLEGPDAGASITVEDETLTVGSAAGNDLVVHDETVSRYHLELVRLPRGVRVVDLGSTNGTLVAGVRLERGIVQPGTVLELGASRLRIRGGDQAMIELHTTDALGALRGRTPSMRRLMARLVKVAASDVAVLLVGESGTGKELIARALHDNSRRAAGPFVTVDCGALASHLVASELFGHERGAFTGADQQRIGAFELAQGGTLFLDEVGELPGDLQSYLLGARLDSPVRARGALGGAHQEPPRGSDLRLRRHRGESAVHGARAARGRDAGGTARPRSAVAGRDRHRGRTRGARSLQGP